MLSFNKKFFFTATVILSFFISEYSYSQKIIIGINTHVTSQSINDVKRSINEIKNTDIKFIRMDMPWKLIEKKKGELSIPTDIDQKISLLLENNIEPILILDYGNKFYDKADKPISNDAISAFSRYAAFVADHFKGKVYFYQIWNEWDGNVGNTTPGDVNSYKKLVKSVYPEVKKIDTKIKIITSSFSAAAFNKPLNIDNRDYLDQFLTSDMVQYTDIIAIHPYTTYRKGKFFLYSGYRAQVDYAMKKIQNGPFKEKKVFITEMGWSTSTSQNGVSDYTQKNNLSNAICYAQKTGVSAIIIYELRDGSGIKEDTESNFGILKHDWEKKESYSSVTNIKCNKK